LAATTPPATANPFPTPDTPTVLLFEPTSSTKVAAGGTVTMAYGFANVDQRPLVTLAYATASGRTVAATLDVFTGKIRVPRSWTPGEYRLQSVTVDNFGIEFGVHYRNNDYVGTDWDGTVAHSRYILHLSNVDLKVSAPLGPGV
jgi:hypothetical protein